MYTLYYSPGAASFAVHWMLIELDVPFRLSKIDLAAREQRSTEFLALNPEGHVPAMTIDGIPRAECGALLMLLAERHPERKLAPQQGDEGRAEYLQTMFYLANTLQPAFRRWFYADEVAGPDNVDAVRLHARAKIESAWEQIDRRFGDGRHLILGRQLCAADFLLTMLMRWSRNMPLPANKFHNIAGYVTRMWSMPSLRLAHQREQLADWLP